MVVVVVGAGVVVVGAGVVVVGAGVVVVEGRVVLVGGVVVVVGISVTGELGLHGSKRSTWSQVFSAGFHEVPGAHGNGYATPLNSNFI